MKSVYSKFETIRAFVPFVILLGIVYIITNACAPSGAPKAPTSGRFYGLVFLDSIPGSTGRLHLHATCIKPASYAAGAEVMVEDSIPLYLYQLSAHDTINGHDYIGKFYSYYETIGQDYAVGTWQIDSAFVDNGVGAAWQGKILRDSFVFLPITSAVDTLDFTR